LETTRQVLTIFKNIGLRLKVGKCLFCVRQLDVLGYNVSSDGLRPADTKINDLVMRPPKNKEKLQSLFGYIIYYYDRFLRDRASVFAPLYKLLENGAVGVEQEAPGRA
jgi:hypothetical protein